TVPLKEGVLPLLDELTAEAERIAAVNTIIFRGAHLVGDNTDARGFARALCGRVRLAGGRAVLVGAGGGARAVAAGLGGALGREFVVANRTPARGEALAAWLRELGAPGVEVVSLEALRRGAPLEEARLVVNTTPLGLARRSLAVRVGATPRRCLFLDLVCGAAPSPFLRASARPGRPTPDGAAMLPRPAAPASLSWPERPATLPPLPLARP